MKTNQFFFIHIPKTGGSYFKSNILPSLLDKTVIETTPGYFHGEVATAHWCWFEPFIANGAYVFTMLRNPAKRIVSQFCWQASLAINRGVTNYTPQDISKPMFYKWLEDGYEKYQNVQAKSLVYYNNDHSIYTASKNLRWMENDVPRVDHFLFSEDFIKFKIDKDKLSQNIKRIDLVTKLKDFHKHPQKILDRITSDLNIAGISSTPLNNNFANPISKDLFSKFTYKEIEWLYEYQAEDSDLYFSDIFTVI